MSTRDRQGAMAVPANLVTAETIAAVIEPHFQEISVDEDGDVVVNSQHGRYFLTIDPNRKIIKLACQFRVKPEASTSQKLDFVNRVNDEVVFARFASSQASRDVIYSDYYLTYDSGLLVDQLVASILLFSAVSVGSVRNLDTADIIT